MACGGADKYRRKRRKKIGKGKYLEMVNICGGEERRKKRRKIFGEGKSDDGQTDRQNFLL